MVLLMALSAGVNRAVVSPRSRENSYCRASLLSPVQDPNDRRNGKASNITRQGSFRLFLDSADLVEWESWSVSGLFYGITTNPSVLQRDGVACTLPSLRQLADQAVNTLGASEIQLQAWGTTTQEITRVGLQLAEFPLPVVVKVPITREGVAAAAQLIKEGVPVTLTGIYAAHQALVAAACGASYAAPYLGRMDDAGRNGKDEIVCMQRLVDGSGIDMRVLVASVRQPTDMALLASQGCNTFTISPACAAQLFDEELTIDAAEAFQMAAVAMGAPTTL